MEHVCEDASGFSEKDIAPGALEKPVCRIWLKIGILVDFEVLNKVQMDLKALAPLLDPLRVT
jgi:hypothetical protein